MRTLLDANAILRHLLDDVPDQANIATEAIEKGAEITPEVLAECVYVLTGFYGLSRSLVSDTLLSLLSEVRCERMQIMKIALSYLKDTPLDFVDCILLASNRMVDQPILTFDKQLSRYLNV